jgi:hypothetical protein
MYVTRCHSDRWCKRTPDISLNFSRVAPVKRNIRRWHVKIRLIYKENFLWGSAYVLSGNFPLLHQIPIASLLVTHFRPSTAVTLTAPTHLSNISNLTVAPFNSCTADSTHSNSPHHCDKLYSPTNPPAGSPVLPAYKDTTILSSDVHSLHQAAVQQQCILPSSSMKTSSTKCSSWTQPTSRLSQWHH